MNRIRDLDALRGLLLVMMTLTHLPTVWQGTLVQPLGYVSAAEGFVLLSAFLAGQVCVRLARNGPPGAATAWSWGRVRQLYLIHLVLLLMAYTLVAWIAERYDRPAARNLLGHYFEDPLQAVAQSVFLIYRPPLLDILPLYILLVAITPAVLALARRAGWARVLAGSAVIWLAAQFGLRSALHGALDPPIALNLMGSFDLFAWQLLWVGGLWFGTAGLPMLKARPERMQALLRAAAVLATLMLVYRHLAGPHGWMDLTTRLFWLDKWSLSPLRILNIAAITGTLMLVGPAIASRLRALLRPFEILGRASLWVFTAHLASLLLLLCVVGSDDRLLDGATGLATLAAGFAALFVAAALQRAYRSRTVPSPGS